MLSTPSESPDCVPPGSTSCDGKRKRDPQSPSQRLSHDDDPDTASSASRMEAVGKRVRMALHSSSPGEDKIEDEPAQNSYEDEHASDASGRTISRYPANATQVDPNIQSAFAIDVRYGIIPEGQLHPVATGLCVMCDNSAYQMCMYCGDKSEIGWCSSSHVTEFEDIHLPQSRLCHDFQYSQRQHPALRRLVYFPVRGHVNPACC